MLEAGRVFTSAARDPARLRWMGRNLAWTLKVVALVIVGTGLLVGVVYDEIRTELGMLGVGGALFLFGHWLESRYSE